MTQGFSHTDKSIDRSNLRHLLNAFGKFPTAAEGCRYPHQLGWQRTSLGQCICGTPLAKCEIWGGLYQRLPKRKGRCDQLTCLLHLLQSGAHIPQFDWQRKWNLLG